MSTDQRAPSPSDGGLIYVASRASLPERGEMWRKLRAEGVPINSTWIDEDGPKASRDLSGLWVRIADEVTSASRLILYVEPDDFPLKGALIEVGMALAAGVPVFIVAPGVDIEERNMRPLGSWMLHPLVTQMDTVHAAITYPLADRLTAFMEANPLPPDAGFVVVPEEPTEEMRKAAFDVLELNFPFGGFNNGTEARDAVYRAMLAAAPTPPTGGMTRVTRAAEDVLAERQRQVGEEGWTPEHDDEHSRFELSRAASCYAGMPSHRTLIKDSMPYCPFGWPWDANWWKPANDRRDLVKAGALILAEIERLDRLSRGQEPGR